jgi:hypothetical protein
MTSRPDRSIAKAALKKLGPLQNDTWPKGEPGSPSVQLPWRSAPRDCSGRDGAQAADR